MISTACNGLFQIDTENTDNIVNLFLFNMTLLLQGKIVGGNPSKLLERDATLEHTMKGACVQTVHGEVQGPHYEFDLSTGQRKLYDFSYQGTAVARSIFLLFFQICFQTKVSCFLLALL